MVRIFTAILCFVFPFSAFSKEEGKVLSYSIETEIIGQYEPVVPLNKKTGFIQEEKHEFLIEAMDVYGLSSHARVLAMPHMVNANAYWRNNRSGTQGIDWERIIQEASSQYGVSRKLIRAVVLVESNFTSEALSHKGAQGAMQLMPETQKELGVVDPFDPRENIFAGTYYLKQQLEFFNGNVDLALAGYNAGRGNVQKYKGIPPFAETRNFVKKVKENM